MTKMSLMFPNSEELQASSETLSMQIKALYGNISHEEDHIRAT